jgi:actin-like ATPase involved in cell morphogenesis
MSLADIATCESIRTGGDDMDEAVINHLKRTYNLLVGEPRAEKVKIQIGSAVPLEEELTMEVSGRDTISGLPRKIVITSEEIREALKEPVATIIDGVTRVLEKQTGTGRRPHRKTEFIFAAAGRSCGEWTRFSQMPRDLKSSASMTR